MVALAATRDYQRAQQSLRATTYRDVGKLWGLLDPQRLDKTFTVFAAAVLQLIRARRQSSATLARAYLQALRTGVVGEPPVVDTPPVPTDAVLTSLRVTSVITIKSAMTNRVALDVATRNALVRTMGAVDKYVGDAGRELIRASVEADPAAQGWRRQTLGTCDYCASEAASGGVQSGSSDFPRHDHCGCVPEPVYEDAVPAWDVDPVGTEMHNTQTGDLISTVIGNEGGIEFIATPSDEWAIAAVPRQDIASSINAVHDQLPNMQKVVVYAENGANSLAHAGGGRSISYTAQFADDAFMANYAREWKGLGIAGGGDAASARYAVTVHEMGHNVQNQIERLSDVAQAEIQAFINEPVSLRSLGFEVGDVDKMVPRWQYDCLRTSTGKPQSAYANERPWEWFAEAFADGLLHGPNASQSGKRALALAKKWLA